MRETSPEAAVAFAIREAGPDDAATVAALVEALNAHEGLPQGHATPAAMRRDMKRAAITVLLAEAAGEAIGHCLYHYAYESTYAAEGLYIVDLFVVEPWQRQGVGRALVAETARRAKSMGGVYLWWTAKPENDRANAAYAGFGAFREPVIAHAVFDESFERLVAEGEARHARPPA